MTLLWDWNGTLLDDTQAAVGALGAILRRRGLASVSMEEYRETFSFPSRNYYGRVGLDLASEDWSALAEEYHSEYLALPRRLKHKLTRVGFDKGDVFNFVAFCVEHRVFYCVAV